MNDGTAHLESESRSERLKRFVIYTVIGTPILFTNAAAVHIGEQWLGLAALPTFLLTVETNTLAAFFLHHYITFNDLRKQQDVGWFRALALFHLSSVVTGSTYLMSSTLLVEWAGLGYQLAGFSALVIANLIGFSLKLRMIYQNGQVVSV